MNKSEIDITRSSIFFSVLLAGTPVALYFLAEKQSGAIEQFVVAAFFFSIGAPFFLAKIYSDKVALLSILRWAVESFATFGRGYRLYFYGGLALCGGLVSVFKAVKLLVGM